MSELARTLGNDLSTGNNYSMIVKEMPAYEIIINERQPTIYT